MEPVKHRSIDTSLVTEARGGSTAAFNRLAAERVDALYATATRILRDSAAAEDATQDALLDAWRHIGSLKEADRFDAWLYRVLVNKCTSELRRRDERRRGLRLLVKGEPDPDAPSTIAERDELERAFRRLSPDHRAALVLRYYLGWTPAEIARTLGVRAGTISSRLHYGLSAMRAALAADARSLEDRVHG